MRPHPSLRPPRMHFSQGGMTLVECVVATLLSAIVLAGLSQMMTVTMESQQADKSLHESYTEAKLIMQRLSWAIETADRKKRAELSAKALTTTGDWLYRYDPVLQRTAKLEYAWSPLHRSLREIGDNGLPTVVLSKVTNFTVESLPTTSDVTLIKVSLTLDGPSGQLVLTETRRLGGPW